MRRATPGGSRRDSVTTDPSAIGLVEYLLAIFLPGIGAGELLGLWEGKSMMERIALAFGVGLAIDTVILVVRTSGLSVAGLALKGIDSDTLYLLTAAGAIALLGSVAARRRFAFPSKPNWPDVALAFIILVQASMVILYFQRYPIFPQYDSPDFGAHVQLVQSLISGGSSIPGGILYYGVHFQLASALLLAGGEGLITTRVTMGILVVLSPLLFYLVSSQLFGNRNAALVSTLVYSLSGSAWFDMVFNAGLYANFFGILAILTLLASLVELDRHPKSVPCWVLFLLVTGMTYFSHYTVVTIIPALFIYPLTRFIKEKKFQFGYFLPPVVFVGGGLAALLVYPGLVSSLLSQASSPGGGIAGGTSLASLLAGFPFAGYLAVAVSNDLSLVVLFLLSLVCIAKCVASRNLPLLIPVYWFLSLMVAAPFNLTAWRFSVEALVPLLLMAGYGFYTALPKAGFERRRSGEVKYVKLGLVFFIILGATVIGSWGGEMVVDSTTNTSLYNGVQHNVYSAILWLGSNTTAGSSYLSVSDWKFKYTDLILGRTTGYAYIADQAVAVKAAQQEGYRYIIVTYDVTASLPPVESYYPWYTYTAASNFTLVYSNPDVKIFQLVQ